MKKAIVISLLVWSACAFATEYTTPECYEAFPTTCSFDEMTLSLCNKEGKSKNMQFMLSQRIHIPGGNKFGNKDGGKICTVSGIKDTNPKRYKVEIK